MINHRLAEVHDRSTYSVGLLAAAVPYKVDHQICPSAGLRKILRPRLRQYLACLPGLVSVESVMRPVDFGVFQHRWKDIIKYRQYLFLCVYNRINRLAARVTNKNLQKYHGISRRPSMGWVSLNAPVCSTENPIFVVYSALLHRRVRVACAPLPRDSKA